MGFINTDAPPRPAAPPSSLSPSQPAPASATPPSPACLGTSHPGCPTQLCLSPPPDVHPSRPSPLTYPPRSGVHIPQCPAPRPGPALAPGMPRAASRLSSRRASRSGFHRISLFPPVAPQTPSHTHSSRATEGSGLFPRVLCGRARPTSPPFLAVSRPGDYNSQRPPRGGGADSPRPRPSARPRPRPPKSAREVRGANLRLQCSADRFRV